MPHFLHHHRDTVCAWFVILVGGAVLLLLPQRTVLEPVCAPDIAAHHVDIYRALREEDAP